MALKPSLVLRQSQQLKMTPQLQQAIKLLQLSTIELEAEIQENLEANPMLEELEADETSEESTSQDTPDEPIESESATQDASSEGEATPDSTQDGSEAEGEGSGDQDAIEPANPEVDGDVVPDTHEELVSENLSEDLPVDSVWEDVWDDYYVQSVSRAADDDGDYLETRNAEEMDLQDHLLDQISLLNLSETDQLIAYTIVESLDADGVLTTGISDLHEGLDPELEIELDEVEAVLHLIQHLDPVGVAARDLRECLLIQLQELPDETPWKSDSVHVVDEYLEHLGNRDYAQVLRRTKLKEEELGEVLRLIATLNPHPGSAIAPVKIDVVEPDVIVTQQNGRWKVELNPKSSPRIRVNPEYAALVRRADNSDDNVYMRNHLQEARWFIKSLQQRNDTLLRVATKIVEYQRGFLEYGEEAMKPLVLHDIAEAVNLHESTISRVTTQKYMDTPSGIFELKYFFSSHVSTHAGGEVSSIAIRALIKKLVAAENPRRPLSDSKISSLLADQDIKVARRTIAKYRESLNIPPSNERKRLS